tara:strand:+ start:309 stop:491 length:183 start_codon:yes stop_codon:yes gene_type:complete
LRGRIVGAIDRCDNNGAADVSLRYFLKRALADAARHGLVQRAILDGAAPHRECSRLAYRG